MKCSVWYVERNLKCDYVVEEPLYAFKSLKAAEDYLRYKTSPVNRAAASYECVYEIRCKYTKVGYDVWKTYYAL